MNQFTTVAFSMQTMQ